MPIPQPNRPVRGSTSGRPIMALLDLLGRRWVLRILWELREEMLTFNELQRRCDSMSTSVLSQRLGELGQSQLVLQTESHAYQLTPLGQELIAALIPLHTWAGKWAEQLPLDDESSR